MEDKGLDVRARAAELIGARPLSKKELTRRLVEKGAAEDEAAGAADWLEELGAVDDAAYAASIARHYGERGYGPGRVREELRRRGIDRELWEGALAILPDPAETLDALLRKRARRGPDDRRELQRAADALARRGFEWEDVRSALERYVEMEED